MEVLIKTGLPQHHCNETSFPEAQEIAGGIQGSSGEKKQCVVGFQTVLPSKDSLKLFLLLNGVNQNDKQTMFPTRNKTNWKMTNERSFCLFVPL